jgi:D-aminopeptidase
MAPRQSGKDGMTLRARGHFPGILPAGRANSICDVGAVKVGHCDVSYPASGVLTGVTAIIPRDGSLRQDPVQCAVHVANGYGKFIGLSQIAELGELETPIILTNTLAAPVAASALSDWTLAREPEHIGSVNSVVGEVNDSRLNAIRTRAVLPEHVFEALDNADVATAQGCIGAGMASEAYGYKGGIGTASRVFASQHGEFTLGCLVCTNQDGHFTPLGRNVPQSLQSTYLKENATGSIIVVLATDARLDSRQLGRLARRAPLGIARTGSAMSHGSGDYTLAFSTAPTAGSTLPDTCLSVFFQAAMEATEEAILNAMFAAAATQTSRGYLPRFAFEEWFA